MSTWTPGTGTALRLHCIGVDFACADPGVRELVALSPDDVKSLLRRARMWLGATEVAVLATCNRTELYVVESGDLSGLDLWHRTIGRRTADNCPALSANRFHLEGVDAAEHLLRVAAGLESALLGDSEIVGQVRAARDLAAAHETVGTVLHRLFDVASRTGRRARAETTIAAGGAGVGSSVTELVQRRTGGSGVVAVIGAGDAADAICRQLRESTDVELRIVNRTFERADRLAVKHEGRAFALPELRVALAGADVVVAAVHHDGPLVDRSLVEAMRRCGHDWSPLLIDACARSITTSDIDLETVRIDDGDLRRSQLLGERLAAVPATEAIVAEELAGFAAWHRDRALDAVIADLFREADAITEAASRELRDDAARSTLRRAVRQLAHHHATTLRAAEGGIGDHEGRL